jgi:spectinomycin phosphotransferase
MVHSAPGPIDRWLRHIHDRGARVVMAAAGFGANPRVLSDGQSWVVYPFIEGAPYSGTAAQIEAAGALLGHIHVAGPFNDWGLETWLKPPSQPWEWVMEHADRAAMAMGQAGMASDAFLRRVEDAWSVEEPPGGLPAAGGSFDFKASNLVFATGSAAGSVAGPVLVDPDHAAYLPRLYDLAIAVLLFHADCGGAPARLWTGAEWRAFLDGYTRIVRFTDSERAAWPDVLRLAWLHQAVWLLGNWPGGWRGKAETAFLHELASLELQSFTLS